MDVVLEPRTLRDQVHLFLKCFCFQNELENFPIGSIQLCQAVMNSCSYDSILALVCKDQNQTRPDLHLFQCDDIKVRTSGLHRWSSSDFYHQ